jgi:16S rRNA (uracil1498-N3)-methyltransferase
MQLPFFYIESFGTTERTIALDEATSKHVVQVLRMNEGEKLNLTDGKGNLMTCEIIEAHKKHCVVELKEISLKKQGARKISVAISLLKNTNRFEWFLEKATEIGVSEIIPLICERTEKEKFRNDRMQGICISAMLQSQQCWLPVLHEPVALKEIIEKTSFQQKYIAHCDNSNKRLLSEALPAGEDIGGAVILIGPEGDFTPTEIESALQKDFVPVSLGETRLRSETAGVVAVAFLQQS